MKITSVLEFMQWINESPKFDMYRGQLDAKWPLLPSIARYADHVKDSYDSVEAIERYLINWFERYSTPYKDYRPIPYVEKLIDGQHYGLPTRLLDWTTNSLKALYFAVEKPEFDNTDGAVYGFTSTTWRDGTKYVKFDGERLDTFFPEFLNERIGAQEGCFTAFPLPTEGFRVFPLTKKNYPKDVSALEKIRIQAKSKAKIRFSLNKLGINQRTIYPGLEGVAKWVKSDLADYGL